MDGTCLTCPSGRQATPDRTSCERCPLAYAGQNGICALCPPGTAQKADQSGCSKCMPGSYRKQEIIAECLPCPVGMVSDSADEVRDECFCPSNKYDLLDADGVVSPIWCLPHGLQTAPHVLDENRISVKECTAGKSLCALPCLSKLLVLGFSRHADGARRLDSCQS